MRYLLVVLTLLCTLPGAASTPAEMIDQIVKNPGYYMQNCNGPDPLPPGELPLFGYKRTWRDEKISPANFEKLRAQRKAVLQDVAAELATLDPSKTLRAETLLMIVLDLNGVEALSALGKLEKRLNQKAQYAKPAKMTMYPLQVQVLSTMTAILKNEGAKGVDKLGPKATFDRAHRDQIVQLADDFLNNVEPTSWKRQAAMTPKPGLR